MNLGFASAGFYGDGTDCEECTICAADATTNDPCIAGSTSDTVTCMCNTGFFGNGQVPRALLHRAVCERVSPLHEMRAVPIGLSRYLLRVALTAYADHSRAAYSCAVYIRADAQKIRIVGWHSQSRLTFSKQRSRVVDIQVHTLAVHHSCCSTTNLPGYICPAARWLG